MNHLYWILNVLINYQGEIREFLPWESFAKPPELDFEVRVIVWKTRNPPDFSSGIIDMYIKCRLAESVEQSTDTHLRAKGFKGSFNWRMKFPVKLPLTGEVTLILHSPHAKIAHATSFLHPQQVAFMPLHISIWDADLGRLVSLVL